MWAGWGMGRGGVGWYRLVWCGVGAVEVEWVVWGGGGSGVG